MNCIILLLLLFCGGNSCGNGCGSCGNGNHSSCGNNNSCGARRSEESGRSADRDRDRRPPRPDFPNFTPVDDPAFSRRNDGKCETCGCEQNS